MELGTCNSHNSQFLSTLNILLHSPSVPLLLAYVTMSKCIAFALLCCTVSPHAMPLLLLSQADIHTSTATVLLYLHPPYLTSYTQCTAQHCRTQHSEVKRREVVSISTQHSRHFCSASAPLLPTLEWKVSLSPFKYEVSSKSRIGII